MKPLAVLVLVLLSLSGYTQTQTPKKEFAIVLSQDKIEISGSESKEIEITILRSKAYLKSSALMGLSSSIPKGIEVTFSPEKGNFDVTKVIIKSSNAVPGQYSIIVNATLNGRTKGSIIKLNVSDKAIASDGKQ